MARIILTRLWSGHRRLQSASTGAAARVYHLLVGAILPGPRVGSLDG
jgi:hypothetical protein